MGAGLLGIRPAMNKRQVAGIIDRAQELEGRMERGKAVTQPDRPVVAVGAVGGISECLGGIRSILRGVETAAGRAGVVDRRFLLDGDLLTDAVIGGVLDGNDR